MVGTGTLHTVAAVLQAAPEIAAAHNNADLNTHGHRLLDHITHLADDVKIQAPVGSTGQSFAGDL